ncbi:sensor histidine kinase [Arachnia propionica]|uniref:histidine kinase n=1 Tax=Arachnia propionica TaxID=1750 RepID=A0A3P1WPL2_9ACTN|nr:histidine kinase [Arachnia propionica]RRD48534.1 hypothetical protein EII35_12450 [Arachnia propionica]
MRTLKWGTWGPPEYYTLPPQWLRLGLPCVAFVTLLSDLDIIRHDPWDSLTLWITLEAVLSYAAIGISLISAKASMILCTLAMGTTFATQRPGFPLVASLLILLALTSLCQPRLPLIQCLTTVAWVALVVWHHDIVQPNNLAAFWWISMWLTMIVVLVGLALRFLVIRTAQTQKHLKAVEAQQERIRQEERHNLARELHDVVAHHMTVITMQVMAQSRSYDVDELRETLKIIDNSARYALADLRALLQVLNSGQPDEPQPLSPHMVPSPSLIEQMEQKEDSLSKLGFRVSEMSVDPGAEELPFSLKTTCTRIIQESTTNIIKHAPPGAACSFVLGVTPTHVTIRITNDYAARSGSTHGSSPAREPDRVHGLTSLRERVRAVGGHYHAGPDEDLWVVEATMPTRLEDPFR